MDICFVDRNNAFSAYGKDMAERRLHYALSRFGREINRITVVTSDSGDGRTGRDQRCLVRLEFHRGGTIEMSQNDEPHGKSIALIASRLSRAVARKLEQRRRFERRSIRCEASMN